MVYYGVSLNIATFSGNIFTNNAICGAVELPAYILCVPLLRWGRKRSVCLTLAIVGVALVAVAFLKDDLSDFRFPMAMFGKLCVTATFSIIFVQTAELYPTVVRDTGLGVSSSVGRIGSTFAPYISLLPLWNPKLAFAPMLIYGCFSFLALIAALFLPETSQASMPNTFEEAVGPINSSDSDSVQSGDKLSIPEKQQLTVEA